MYTCIVTDLYIYIYIPVYPGATVEDTRCYDEYLDWLWFGSDKTCRLTCVAVGRRGDLLILLLTIATTFSVNISSQNLYDLSVLFWKSLPQCMLL